MKNYGRLVWTEIAVDAIVEAVVQSEEMAPDHIETRALLQEFGAVTSVEQLKASLLTRYSQSQVDEVFAKFQISSITEFKQRMNAFVQFFYKAPPAFDANDPNNEKDFPVSVCLKFQPDLNVFDALQNAKLCREIRAREHDFKPVVMGAEVRSPFVFVTIFPASVVVDNAIPNMTASQIKNDVQGLFESEGMMASFFGP